MAMPSTMPIAIEIAVADADALQRRHEVVRERPVADIATNASHVAAGVGTRNDVPVAGGPTATTQKANSPSTPSAPRPMRQPGRERAADAQQGVLAAPPCAGRSRAGSGRSPAPAASAAADAGRGDDGAGAARSSHAPAPRRSTVRCSVDVGLGELGHEEVGEVGFLLGQPGLDEERVDPAGHLGQRGRVIGPVGEASRAPAGRRRSWCPRRTPRILGRRHRRLRP